MPLVQGPQGWGLPRVLAIAGLELFQAPVSSSRARLTNTGAIFLR